MACQRPLVLGLQGNLRVQAHQAHHLDGLAQVVEDQEVVGQHQPGFGHGAGRGQLRQPLDIAHHVVAQITHQPPPKTGQSGSGHRPEVRQQAAQVLKGIDAGLK